MPLTRLPTVVRAPPADPDGCTSSSSLSIRSQAKPTANQRCWCAATPLPTLVLPAACDRMHGRLVQAERDILTVQESNTASVKGQLQQFIPQVGRGGDRTNSGMTALCTCASLGTVVLDGSCHEGMLCIVGVRYAA